MHVRDYPYAADPRAKGVDRYTLRIEGETKKGNGMSRRELMRLGVAGSLGLAATNAFSRDRDAEKVLEETMSETMVGPKLVEVPQAIPERVYTSERVGISRKTHDEHLKLWQGYANKTNEIRKALAEMEVDPAKANQIYSQMRAFKVDYTFAYEGYINHNVYFETLGGQGGPATGKVAQLIDEAYGSFDKWVADLKATGIAGRGWVYLAYEHAYYLDFGTARAKYIEAYLQCIDWDAVNRRGEAVIVP